MTLITEGLVDKRIEQAIRFDKSSDTGLKLAALSVSNIVGNYSAATAQIAKARKRHVSTIENYAHAHWMKLELQKTDPKLARKLWHILPVSHFWRAWEKIHKIGYDALPYLKMAAEHGWSWAELYFNFELDVKAGNAPIQFRRAVRSLRGLAEELQKKHTLNPMQFEALDAVLEAFAPDEVKA